MTTRHPSISTHVLDTELGEPARAVPVALYRREGDQLVLLSSRQTDHDGRIPALLDDAPQVGLYLLSFDVAAYFQRQGRDIAFLSSVAIEFYVQDSQRHYHVPLLLSRYACSSYRGS